jgi:exodeoxyribonuclease VII large subunit
MEKRHLLEMVEEKTKSLDPTLLLARGYSITLKDGRTVRDAQALQKGDEIETRLANGLIRSTVQ